MPNANKKILIIEHDAKIADLGRSTLEEHGYTVMLAADGTNGLARARKEKPDLVIIAFQLPALKGAEVCKRLRRDSETKHIRIVMLADESQIEELEIGPGSSADDFIIKPFNATELITKVNPLLVKEEERKPRQISTGNGDLDTKMGGGVPFSSLTLIEGDSGAGKSVLSQQMIHGCLVDGHKLSVFTSENTVKSLIRQMQSLNFDILDNVLLDQLRVFPLETSRLGQDAPAHLMNAMRGEKSRDMIFVDSLTASIPASSDKEVLGFFEDCKRLCSNGMSVVVIIHSHALTRELLTRIRSLCDAHLQLRTEEVGSKLVKTLEVTKVRGAEQTTGNIVSFEVEPGWGIRVIPINKVKG